ncbi:hypothetical protein TCT1_23480 [Xenorhabdus sp. TCT-1]|uniref:Uncharacterized protein n=1 Tax=Xenorhabdus taiwanensis TaxID=3085177 RepID=A0ABM8JXJ0_9GAMM|nr:hypothetical protein TCT1_23480 [Xenorhabdus sp. TCT-1]
MFICGGIILSFGSMKNDQSNPARRSETRIYKWPWQIRREYPTLFVHHQEGFNAKKARFRSYQHDVEAQTYPIAALRFPDG